MAKRTRSDFYVSLEDRQDLVATKGLTLNGQPALIQSPKSDFALVVQKGSGLSAEWSWEAVRRIVAKGGKFQS